MRNNAEKRELRESDEIKMKIKREKNADGSFLVGNVFVEQFLQILSGSAVKVYLYLKYACDAGADVSIIGISRAAGISREETEDAVREIRAAGLVYFDETGEKSLVITSDAGLKNAKDRFLDSRYLKRLEAQGPDADSEYAEVRRNINEEFFGGSMHQNWYNILEKLEKEYGFRPETVYLLFRYCSARVDDFKMSGRYVLKVAESWFAEKIITPEDVEKKLRDSRSDKAYIAAVRKLMGYSRYFTQEEKSVITGWKDDGITEGMLGVFLSDTGRVGAYTVKIINDEIGIWKRSGLDSEEALREYYAKRRDNKSEAGFNAYLDELGTLMGIRRPFTKAEKDAVRRWFERGVTTDMLKVLLGDTGRVGAFTVAKIGVEVEAWNREGIRTAGDVKKRCEAAAREKEARGKNGTGAAGAYGGDKKNEKRPDTRRFDNERQYDDEFFRHLENKNSGGPDNK